MKFIKRYTSIIFLTGLALFSCEKSTTNPGNLVIETGTSFGECLENCYQSIIFNTSSTDIAFVVKDYQTADETGIQRFKDSFTEKEHQEILDTIDFEEFSSLNEDYGCPDCADGGAEFIKITDRITTGEPSHMVTFEYGKSVNGIEKLITLLRKKREELSNQYINQ